MIKKLNLGCGIDIKTGFINADIHKFYGADKIIDFNKFPYPLKDNSMEEVDLLCILEIVDNHLKVLEETHRICKNGGIVKIDVPAFPSPNCVMNPMIKHFFSYNYFTFFEPYDEDDKGYGNHSFKFKFHTIRREYVFSRNKLLKWVNPIVNLYPKFYTRFLFNIFPSDRLYFELKVIK